MAKKRPPPPVECPHCGESFPAGRKACPECGSDAQTGWQSGDEIDYQSLDIPDAYSHDDYERDLDGIHANRPALWSSRQMRMFIVGIILVASMTVPMLVYFLRSR
ncbi:MAG: hydrogenase maturation nickel metallochaperone HypA [Planctomycetes bacterium]|nr:hydrogenase maturation nickel metallochaperone HypA [Planctomycetota bacterium]